MVCQYLHQAQIHQAEIASLRLVDRVWNFAATPYLFLVVVLQSNMHSFDRLTQISNDPYLCQHVKCLNYEPNGRPKMTRKEWDDTMVYRGRLGCHRILSFPESPPAQNAPAHDHRLWQRNRAKWHIGWEMEQFAQAWKRYEYYIEEQRWVQDREYGVNELTIILSRLHVSEINMNHGSGLWRGVKPPSNMVPYADAMTVATSDFNFHEGSGVPAMRSLLLAISASRSSPQSLRIGHVSWKFTRQAHDTWEKMKIGLARINLLHLLVSAGRDQCFSEDPDFEQGAFVQWLTDGGLHDFLMSAYSLLELGLNFDLAGPYSAYELKYAVQSTTWPFLKQICLSNFSTTGSDWLSFPQRHATTLRNMTIDYALLMEGSWIDVLEHMQEILTLECANVYYALIAYHPPQHWSLFASEDTSDSNVKTREAIQEFLVKGGTCPLRDKEAHPQTLLDIW